MSGRVLGLVAQPDTHAHFTQRSLLPAQQRKLELDHSTESVWTISTHDANGVVQRWLLTSSEGETQVREISSKAILFRYLTYVLCRFIPLLVTTLNSQNT